MADDELSDEQWIAEVRKHDTFISDAQAPACGARERALEEAARALCNRLDEIVAHPSYQAQVSIAHIHWHRYNGPTWVDELAALRALLTPAVPRLHDHPEGWKCCPDPTCKDYAR